MEISIQKSRKSPGCIDERWRMIEGRSCCEKERDTVVRESREKERNAGYMRGRTARKGEKEERERERGGEEEDEEESGR